MSDSPIDEISIHQPRPGDGAEIPRAGLDAGIDDASRQPDLFQVPVSEGLPEVLERWALGSSKVRLPVRDALWMQISAMTDPVLVGVYLAHLIHRQIDWSIRHHERMAVDGWLGVAATILGDLPGRAGCAVESWPSC